MKPLVRLHDWEQRLSSLIAANARRAHEYGQWDCLLWPAAAVKAVTGKDFGRGHRGKYKSQASAYRHLQQLGFASPEALLDSLFDECPPAFAQRGDLVLVAADDPVPGVVIGATALVIVADAADYQGFAQFQRTAWVKGWKVGR